VFPLKDNIPTERFPFVTVALIAINVFVFLFLQHPTGFSSVDNETVVKYGAIPYELTHPGKHCGYGDKVAPGGKLVTSTKGTVVCEGTVVQTSEGPTRIRSVTGSQPSTWLTIFTAMFMHGGFLHIIGNMLFLWIFGNNVEDAMGPLKFLVFYLLSGIAALALQVAFNTDSTVPTIGASGAIAGVLGGYILLYPRARVLTLIFLIFFVTFIEVPAVLVLGLWFLQQLYFGVADLSDPTGGGVAYFAHIGGFAFGLIFVRVFATRMRRPPEPRLPVY
jgi:membrane associated rhomboid family serine protease